MRLGVGSNALFYFGSQKALLPDLRVSAANWLRLIKRIATQPMAGQKDKGLERGDGESP